MHGNVRNESGEESAAIDLTPMLDVVFIMLIFFIITAAFIREASISLERPATHSPPASTEHNTIVVSLQQDNQILIAGRRIDHRSLRAYFERHRANYPDSALIINAHNGSQTRAVVRISDAARQAGLYRISLTNGEKLRF